MVLSVKHLSKHYYVHQRPYQRLLQFIRPTAHVVSVLEDISFELKPGETLGIVGANGAGKSTLLQLIAGVLTPSSGSIAIRGRIGALLELGSGFNPEFTGRENAYFNGMLLGLTKRDVAGKINAIAEFAELGEFFDRPLKTYSSGMNIRLAFAVQAQLEPELLIVDEALAVGDAKFQQKCFSHLAQLKQQGMAILFVSHVTEQILTHCDRAILLEQGKLVYQGEPSQVINRYLDNLFATPQVVIPLTDEDNYCHRPHYNRHEYRWGDKQASITDFSLLVNDQMHSGPIPVQAKITLKVALVFHQPIMQPILGFAIKTKEGVTIYNTNSELQQAPLTTQLAQLSFTNRLAPGDYFISVGLSSRQQGEVIPHDRRYDSIHLQIADNQVPFFGLIDLNLTMQPI